MLKNIGCISQKCEQFETLAPKKTELGLRRNRFAVLPDVAIWSCFLVLAISYFLCCPEENSLLEKLHISKLKVEHFYDALKMP